MSRPGQSLSGREMQILKGAAEGETSIATGDRLGITGETVRGYKKHILRKMSASNIAHAVTIAFRKGWLK